MLNLKNHSDTYVFVIAARFCECSWTPATVHTYSTAIQSCQLKYSVFCGVCLCSALLQMCSSSKPIII